MLACPVQDYFSDVMFPFSTISHCFIFSACNIVELRKFAQTFGGRSNCPEAHFLAQSRMSQKPPHCSHAIRTEHPRQSAHHPGHSTVFGRPMPSAQVASEQWRRSKRLRECAGMLRARLVGIKDDTFDLFDQIQIQNQSVHTKIPN